MLELKTKIDRKTNAWPDKEKVKKDTRNETLFVCSF